MAAEELVQRVLARDVDRQSAPTPPGAAPHLTQRRDGARERRDDRGVQRADVDAELERVGRDDGVQLAAHEPRLELAALLRRVAGAVRGDALGELGVEHVAHDLRDELDALARLDEADRARAPAHEGGDDRRGLRERRGRACRAPRPPAAGSTSRSGVPRPGSRRGPRARRRPGRSAAPPARPGSRSSRWRAGCAARSRTRRRCGAGAAGRSRRASRTRRGTRAPRRRRRPRGWRTRPPTRGGSGGSRRGACRGS